MSSKYKSGLQRTHFRNVRTGKKLWELRANDEKRQAIRVGHEWILSESADHEGDVLEDAEIMVCVIEDRREFSGAEGFREALEELGVEIVLPGMTLEESVKLYESIDGGKMYKKAEKCGVVAFRLKPLF